MNRTILVQDGRLETKIERVTFEFLNFGYNARCQPIVLIYLEDGRSVRFSSRYLSSVQLVGSALAGGCEWLMKRPHPTRGAPSFSSRSLSRSTWLREINICREKWSTINSLQHTDRQQCRPSCPALRYISETYFSFSIEILPIAFQPIAWIDPCV